MAQYKKEETQAQILHAAELLFANKGYKNTTIADIAKKAGISVGNIYRYYAGKEQLLEQILPAHFVEEIAQKTREKLLTGKKASIYAQSRDPDFRHTSKAFQQLLFQNRYRMCILYRYPEGTPYEDLRCELIDALVEFVLSGFTADPSGRENKRKLLQILYTGYVQMLLNILSSEQEEEEILSQLEQLNAYHVLGLSAVLDADRA